ncbi:MAG: cyclic nucleotide-binding domain-containing protein [Actinobacteria bacterium]|nr:cyclic nucleotide-binding domain-containing protein [Actinomycetota bacterium]
MWNGKIELLRRRADGTNLVMEQLRSGRYFGELAPIFGLPCSMTARAATKAVVTGYTIADFRRQVGAPKYGRPHYLAPASGCRTIPGTGSRGGARAHRRRVAPRRPSLSSCHSQLDRW